jgi:protein SCO1
MRPLTRMALAILAGLLLLALILALALPGGSGHHPAATVSAAAGSRFEGAALPAGAPAPDFTLRDQAGHAVSLRSARAGVTVLAFLYTHCGAVCIVIAQQIRGALDELKTPARVLIVSADPAGDTPASVRRFLAQVSLTGRVSYLTGSPAQLRRIWHAYAVTPASAGHAAFDRFATVTLLDPQARRRVLFQTEQLTPEALAHDIGELQSG